MSDFMSENIYCRTGERKITKCRKNARWTSEDHRTFQQGDIIADRERKEPLRLIVKVDEEGFWCIGLMHAALTENNEKHPIFRIRFDKIDDGTYLPFLKLGNLKDYEEYIIQVQDECKERGC